MQKPEKKTTIKDSPRGEAKRPLGPRRPSESVLSHFVDRNNLQSIQNHRQNIYQDLVDANWCDGKGEPIGNWRSYLIGLNDHIEENRESMAA